MAKPDVDLIFQALGDASRRTILELVTEQPVSVSALAAQLGISLAAVVQHLQVLEAAKLVHTEKVGRVRSCRIDPKGIAAAATWLEQRKSLWERRLDRLGGILKEK